jgi:hypothetical protein
MRPGFLDLPGEIRNDIYKRLLVAPHRIRLLEDNSGRLVISTWKRHYEPLCTAVLATNRTIHDEATSVLYGWNRFDLVGILYDSMFRWDLGIQDNLVASFLEQIGQRNASFLNHLYIDFPRAQGKCPDIALSQGGARMLRLIRDSCTHIETLEIPAGRGIWVEHNLYHDLMDGQGIQDALSLADEEFKAIKSLKKVILTLRGEPYGPGVPFLIRETISNLGWTIQLPQAQTNTAYDSE